MRFVITRPKPDADKLAEQIAGLGHKSWLSPVMKLDWRKVEPPEPKQVCGLVITSRNALRSLEKWHDLSPYMGLPLFAVGTTSANAARNRGFSQVIEAKGRADSLPSLITSHYAMKKNVVLYHPGGEKLAFDLAPELARSGISLIPQIVYGTTQINRLAPAVKNGFEKGTIDGVLLLSPRTARLFVQLLNNNRLGPALSRVFALCLSQKVAEAASALSWRQMLVAPHPDMDQLLALIEQVPTR